MKRMLFLLFANFSLLLLLSACEGVPPPVSSITPTAEATPEATLMNIPTPEPTAVTTPDSTASPTASPKQPEDWETIFRDFFSENYSKLHETCIAGITGIGFIDLDLDGSPELLIFDAGASASMGVQFFDIIGGAAECVSANIITMGEAFGGDNLSKLSVTANKFSEFRLMQDTDTSNRFFIVDSFNAALDFSYHELIRFGGSDTGLTLESVLYIHEDYNIDTGDVTSARYERNGTEISAESYDTHYNEFFGGISDTGYDAEGIFIWETPSSDGGYDWFMAMVESAIKLYKPVPSPN